MLGIEEIVSLQNFFFFLAFVYREVLPLLFPKANNSIAVGLVESEPTPILVWQLSEQALAPVSVQQW